MDTVRKTIIDVLLEKNRLTPNQVGDFDKQATNEQIEAKLRQEKLATSEDIAKAYAVIFDLPFIRLEGYEITPEAFNLIPLADVQKYQLISFERLGERKIKVAIGAPSQLSGNPPAILADLKDKKGLIVELYITTPEDIQKVAARFASGPTAEVKTLDKDVSYPEISHLRTVDLRTIKIPYDVISKFPVEISQKYKMVVFASTAPNTIQVALSDPTDQKVREILDFVRNKNNIVIEEFVASPTEIDESIKLYYRKPEENSAESPNMPVPPPPQNVPTITSTAPISENVTPAPVALAATISNPSNSVQPVTPNERKKFVRRPIPYETAKIQQEQQAQLTDRNEEEMEAKAVIAPENDLDTFLGQPVTNIDTFKNIVQTGNIPQILAGVVALGVAMKASDIHIEAEGADLRFRFRVDGILRDILKAPLALHAALVSRIKILSRMKIDETRVPQDGRFDVKVQGHEIDLRVSTLPTIRGEKAALRILDKSQNIYTLEDLGFSGRNLKVLEENITKPYGVILSTGPTGSGKSTTLYSILKKVAGPSVNVITLEDPVEYEMPGINQCQVKPKIGFSFAEGLRSVLRQDPNIIMVGEIRDAETAGMTTHAALTGHLVLSTLHTNDAAGALPRLTNMGVEPFLITSSINLVIGQRLVRKVCPHCRHEANIPPQLVADIEKELANLNLPKPYKFFEGTGCTECNNGYSGRLGIYEVLSMTEKIEDLAINRRPASEIKVAAIADGMITMKQDGLIKALQGLTTISEVLRVTLIE